MPLNALACATSDASGRREKTGLTGGPLRYGPVQACRPTIECAPLGEVSLAER
jgi:hypothetical protein